MLIWREALQSVNHFFCLQMGFFNFRMHSFNKVWIFNMVFKLWRLVLGSWCNYFFNLWLHSFNALSHSFDVLLLECFNRLLECSLSGCHRFLDFLLFGFYTLSKLADFVEMMSMFKEWLLDMRFHFEMLSLYLGNLIWNSIDFFIHSFNFGMSDNISRLHLCLLHVSYLRFHFTN